MGQSCDQMPGDATRQKPTVPEARCCSPRSEASCQCKAKGKAKGEAKDKTRDETNDKTKNHSTGRTVGQNLPEVSPEHSQNHFFLLHTVTDLYEGQVSDSACSQVVSVFRCTLICFKGHCPIRHVPVPILIFCRILAVFTRTCLIILHACS